MPEFFRAGRNEKNGITICIGNILYTYGKQLLTASHAVRTANRDAAGELDFGEESRYLLVRAAPN
ncbi:hypothetical protein CFter6_0278 [Collimonas fungivorans]|uniref:Uncharacterized protein n=1 Tax=Collimonas fungivorans TaxID=158899 RepID=A0A127P5B6_9BURK|nr:hypothetical protein CFter6_0278 [Collimonas fungivorans]